MNIANDSEARFSQNYTDFSNPRTGNLWVQPLNISWPTPSTSTNPSYVPFNVNSITPVYQPNKQYKRKADPECPVASKQHITEEKMAAHMSRLHISSDSPPVVPEKEPSRAKKMRLYMCGEMRKLQTESIIPAALMSRIERPSMAVVLWQPPNPLLNLPSTSSQQPPSQRQFEPENNNNNNNNNNNSEQDFNRMEFDAM